MGALDLTVQHVQVQVFDAFPCFITLLHSTLSNRIFRGCFVTSLSHQMYYSEASDGDCMGAHMHKVAGRINVRCHMDRKILQLRLIGKVALLNLGVAVPEIAQTVRGIPVQCLRVQFLRDVNNSTGPLSRQSRLRVGLQGHKSASGGGTNRWTVSKFLL